MTAPSGSAVANARQALAVFEEAAVGKDTALTALCDAFDHETRQGRDMARYDELLTRAIIDIKQTFTKRQSNNLRPGGARDFKLPLASQTPADATDFGLVTWLVVKTNQHPVEG